MTKYWFCRGDKWPFGRAANLSIAEKIPDVVWLHNSSGRDLAALQSRLGAITGRSARTHTDNPRRQPQTFLVDQEQSTAIANRYAIARLYGSAEIDRWWRALLRLLMCFGATFEHLSCFQPRQGGGMDYLSAVKRLGFAFVILLCANQSVAAAMITYTFDGVRTQSADTEFPLGDTFSGFLTIDTNIGGNPHPDGTLDAQYAAITDWAATFGNLPATFSGGSGVVAVGDSTVFGDRLSFTLFGAPNVPLPSGRALNFLQFDFQDPLVSGADFLSNDAIPGSIDLSLVATVGGRLFLDDGSQLRVQITELSSVPLPAALPLFGTGLGLMGLFGWRRRRRAAAAV